MRSASSGRGVSTCRAGSRPRPGRKDPRKLRQFIEAARAAAVEIGDLALDLTADEPVRTRGIDRPDAGDDTDDGESRPYDWQLDD